MLSQVVEVERPQQLGDLTLARVGDVVEVCACHVDVVRRIVEVAGGGLGRRQHLEQVPEELRVEVAARVTHREIVQLLGGEAIEGIVGV